MRKKRDTRALQCTKCGKGKPLSEDGWVINAKKQFFCSVECFYERWRLINKMSKGELSWEDISGLRTPSITKQSVGK